MTTAPLPQVPPPVVAPAAWDQVTWWNDARYAYGRGLADGYAAGEAAADARWTAALAGALAGRSGRRDGLTLRDAMDIHLRTLDQLAARAAADGRPPT